MTNQEMQEEINRLQAENNRLKSSTTTNSLSLRVSQKGALSVYGLGRFPVTLYAPQWTRLIAAKGAIEQFVEANKGKLSTTKPPKSEVTA